MKRFDPSNKHEDGMAPRTDGEWIRYADHVEAMKRIAGDAIPPITAGFVRAYDEVNGPISAESSATSRQASTAEWLSGKSVIARVAPSASAQQAEPVLFQRRIRPMWREAGKGWTPWEDCTEESARDHERNPVVHDWQHEVRRLYLAAPAPIASPDTVGVILEMREQAREARQSDPDAGIFADHAYADLLDEWANRLERHDGRMSGLVRDYIEGMSVSIDVSTGEHDAGNRYYGFVSEVMDDPDDKHGVTLLVQDDVRPNFKVSASPAALTAKQRYDECMREDEEPSAVERLRFFCSLAMNGQDWLDVEPFFDALTASPAALTEDQIAVRAGIPFVGLSVTLMKALRRLSFAAQTSGGVAGRDDELMGAIKQAQEALEAAKGKGLEEVAVDPASASSEAASPADQVGDARYWGKYETFGGETRMLWIGPMTRDEMLAYDDEYRHNSRAAMSASKEGV